jgi:formylglycine-generating enzyme required for sulfatase activity
VCTSWEDAQSYVRWLSTESDENYRLLSEAEWEYAARSGTSTTRYWGDDADDACGYANVHDFTSKRVNKIDRPIHICDDGFARTSPVGKFKPTALGLYDMLGNVWEWVEDCWHPDYEGAPTAGTAWSTDCVDRRRTLRGGSWNSDPSSVRSANRFRNDPANRLDSYGFRVAKASS